MQIESGAAGPVTPTASAALTGYDKIALSVVRAMHFNTNAIVPLNVPNRGTLPDLQDEDVVEVPCVVNANGAPPIHVGRVPDRIRPLLLQVKEYERLTVRASLARSPDAARTALAANPLVRGRAAAERLIDDLQPLW